MKKTYTVMAWGDYRIEIRQGVPEGWETRVASILLDKCGQPNDSPNWVAIEGMATVIVGHK